MSAEKLVRDARSALSSLAGLGAVSLGNESVGTWKNLASRARSLGLADLGEQMDALASQVERRGALAFEPNPQLAHAALEVHDHVEALASTLVLWSVERSFAPKSGDAS
jgi:hypothetical protein